MSEVTVIDIDPLTLIIIIVAAAVIGYLILRVYARANRQSILNDKRGWIKQLFDFQRAPTVPTIRIVSRGGLTCIELGKRARKRENSLSDTMDGKGWDISGPPIPIIEGDRLELGYITHPAGCTVEIRPNVKTIRSDENGMPVYTMVPEVDNTGKPVIINGEQVLTRKPEYIEANFEGVIGVHSDLDDFNESTERETNRNWIVPLLVGILAGVMFFAPLFAWFMSMIAGGGK